jgi:hypothetical protein
VIRIPALGIDFTTGGRCGGMAAASMDYWHAHLAVPTDASLPADGSLLADYVYARLMDTILANGWKNFQIMLTPDHPTWFNGIGVARATREQELPKLKQLLDSGKPALLGVTQARSVDALGSDHQVVAYGYETDARYTYVLIYDNNHPGLEVRLRLTSSYDPAEREITQGTGEVWRGFFVENYAPVQPWFLAGGKLLSDRSDPRIYVVRGGGRFHIPSPQEFDAGGYAWSEVLEAQDGSMAHVAAFPANQTLLKERSSDPIYVTYGGLPFHIPSPAVFDALGLDWAAVQTIPDGSLAGLPTVPRDRTLLKELSGAPVYVVEGGKLRHISSPDVFEAQGFAWDGIGVVPDGALAGMPQGQPI